MSLKSCAALGYTYGKDICLPVGVDVKQNELTYDAGWIAGSFFFGLFLGPVFVMVLAVWWYHFIQCKRKILQRGQVMDIESMTVKGQTNVDRNKVITREEQAKSYFKFRFWKTPETQRNQIIQKKEENTAHGDLVPIPIRGMVDVMLQTTKCESEVEMAVQDMVAILSIEKSKQEEKSVLMQHILAILLRNKLKEKAIKKNFFDSFIKKTEEDIKDVNKIIDREKKEDEKKLKSDPKFSKDTQTLETEIQKLHAHYNNKQNRLQRDLMNTIQQKLMRSSGMKDHEVNAIMAELIKNMAVAEEKIGLEQERQRMALEERLAKRKQVVEYMDIEVMENEQEKDTRVEKIKNLLSYQTKENHRLERQADDIVNEFSNDLDGIKKSNTKEFYMLYNEKYNSLQKSRLDRFLKLGMNQSKEKAKFLQTTKQMTSPTDFIEGYHDMVTNHHMENEMLWNDQDLEEVKEIYKSKQDIAKKEKMEISAETEKLAEKLKNKMNVTSSEADRIIKLYKTEMDKYNAGKQKEKQALFDKLQERLNQRVQAANFSIKQDQIIQETLKKEQKAIVNKAIAMNMDLTVEDKDMILKLHEQNMNALASQLLCSKLRQQKSLEIKLNQRKMQLEKLHLMKNNLQKSHEKEKDDLLAKLSADIAKEEQLFEEARQAAVSELRAQLAKETEEALKLQAESISLLIGRLQLSEARRKVVLSKQEGVLNQIQEDLGRGLTAGVKSSSEMETILNSHISNVQHLEEQLQRQKKEKVNIIKDKIRNRKWRLQQETENELEKEAQSEYTYQQNKGVSFASLALIQLLLDQRHAKAMRTLNTEMVAELEKCRSELDLEYELKLKENLETQLQKLLENVAGGSKMSKADIQEALSAVNSGNTDNQNAKQLIEDLKNVTDRQNFQQSQQIPEEAESF